MHNENIPDSIRNLEKHFSQEYFPKNKRKRNAISIKDKAK